MEFSVFIILATLVFLVNLIPWFAPPTWVLLVFFAGIYKLPIVNTIVIGVLFAALGRFVLYSVSERYLIGILPKKSRQNVQYLGDWLNKRHKFSIPLFLLYTLLPISTSELFIAGGLAHYSLSILLICFIIGRTISYGFWVINSRYLIDNTSQLLSSNYTNLGLVLVQLVGILALYIFTKIKWKTLLARLN